MSTATKPAKPTAVAVDLDGIPEVLRARPQWVLWRHEWRKNKNGEWAWSKVPRQVNGRNAAADDPKTWSEFSAVEAEYNLHRDQWGGVGYVFSADDDFAGVDLDACRNPETGELTDWAAEVVNALDSYTEVSPSGLGVKLVLCGRLPIPANKTGRVKKLKGVDTYGDKKPEIAVFDKGRYWCLTGRLSNGSPRAPETRQEQLDAFFAKHFGRKGKGKSTANGTPNNGSAPGNALEKMLEKCRTADDRSGADFALCAEAIRRGWDKEKVWQRLKDIGKPGERGRDYFDATWSNAADRAGEDDETPEDVVSNAKEIEVEDEEGNTKKITVALTMDEILTCTRKQTGDFPRRVDKALFVHDDQHGIGWLEKAPELFGFLHRRVGKVRWHAGKSVVGRSEFFAELQRTARRYIAVESLPHEPMLEGHYYACDQIEPGDGEALRELLARFAPATDTDGDLIKAAFVTPMWGGPTGTRPAFVITSDDGRGAGKSTLAEMIGSLYGGVLQFSHQEDIGKIKTRLLSPEALPRRVCLLDNVKSLKFSWGELEGMITANEIGGHRMYVGEATRPNTLTWFITLNGAALSTDMAQRAVIIKIRKPKRSATWEEGTREFIRQNQVKILGDIIAELRGEKFPLARFSRWATWERDILQLLPEPGEAQAVILERQAATDVDGEEAGIIEDFFRDQLSRLKYKPDIARVFIPSQIAARWYGWATNEKPSVGAACRIINQLVDEGRLRRLEQNKCKAWGRGFVWIGEEAEVTSHISIDLKQRVAESAQGGG